MAIVEVERRGHVAIITLDRPEARNALNPEVIVRLAHAWQEVDDDDDRVAVITGAGDKAFCAGADLGQLIPLTTGARQPADQFDQAVVADPTLGRRAMFARLDAVEAGNHRDQRACHRRRLRDRPGDRHGSRPTTARFGVQEVKWALYPLGRLVGPPPRQPPAFAVAAAAHRRPARRRHLPPVRLREPRHRADQVLTKALEIAEKIAANGPLAVKAIKAGAREAMGRPEQAKPWT